MLFFEKSKGRLKILTKPVSCFQTTFIFNLNKKEENEVSSFFV